MAKKSNYEKQRDKFFKDHPLAQWLLAAFIIAIAIYLGVQYRNVKAREYVILQLQEEGIDPTPVIVQ